VTLLGDFSGPSIRHNFTKDENMLTLSTAVYTVCRQTLLSSLQSWPKTMQLLQTICGGRVGI